MSRSKQQQRNKKNQARGWKWWDGVSLLVIAGSVVAWLTLEQEFEPTMAAPVMSIVEDPVKGNVVRIDDTQWKAAFRDAGLPDLPLLNGTDPIPARTLLDGFERWRTRRDAGGLAQVGQVCLALEEHDSALRCFAALVQLQPDHPRWQYLFAAEAEVMGLTEVAIESFERAKTLDPDYDLTLARLGSLYLERNDLDQAEANFRQYQQRQPARSLGYTGLGRVALARGQSQEALELLNEAVQRGANDFLAHRFRARALAGVGQVEEARRSARVSDRLPRYSGWLTFDSHLQEVHALANTQRFLSNQMRSAMSVQNWEVFAVAAEKMLARRPNDLDTIKNLAKVYRQLQRFEDVERVVQMGLRLDPRSAELYCVRAEVEFAKTNYDAVFPLLEQAERLDPMLARVHDIRGRTLYFQGKADAAIASLEEASRLQPGDSNIRIALAEMYFNSGNKPRAREVIQSVLADDPGNALAMQVKRRIEG